MATSMLELGGIHWSGMESLVGTVLVIVMAMDASCSSYALSDNSQLRTHPQTEGSPEINLDACLYSNIGIFLTTSFCANGI